ncbi:hypothetical protein CSA17_05730 [bacterium DOLJORAL78_65_58]|nr:MAG: hypothetical protein CSB20_08810 [bacterium DOLZORAL124_64_63]PIE75772.1 MAG: hypothetical protein CSA17_05730 [bacterium DOLJORAL78_65_58]
MPKFTTVRFGELEYRSEDVIHLDDGLVGMPNLTSWIILDMGDDVPMKWFQSLDRGDFGFPVSQPYLFHDEYDLSISKGVQARLGTRQATDLATMIITTVHAGGTKVTGNLLAPLVIDTETRKGCQLTVDDARFSMRQEINYFKFGLAVKSEASDNRADVPPEDQSSQARTVAGSQEIAPEPAGV